METIKTAKNSPALINDKALFWISSAKTLLLQVEILSRSENVDDGLLQLSALQEPPEVCIIDLDFNNENLLAQLMVFKIEVPNH